MITSGRKISFPCAFQEVSPPSPIRKHNILYLVFQSHASHRHQNYARFLTDHRLMFCRSFHWKCFAPSASSKQKYRFPAYFLPETPAEMMQAFLSVSLRPIHTSFVIRQLLPGNIFIDGSPRKYSAFVFCICVDVETAHGILPSEFSDNNPGALHGSPIDFPPRPYDPILSVRENLLYKFQQPGINSQALSIHHSYNFFIIYELFLSCRLVFSEVLSCKHNCLRSLQSTTVIFPKIVVTSPGNCARDAFACVTPIRLQPQVLLLLYLREIHTGSRCDQF